MTSKDLPSSLTIKVQWNALVSTLAPQATLQVVVQPPLVRGSVIHDEAFRSLADLNAPFVRFVPWFPFTKYAVAELEPPTKENAGWDFSLIDPVLEDFMCAQAGRSVVMNFSTIPQWMFVTPKPVPYQADPNRTTLDYCQGDELRDPTGKEVGDYFARLLSWYTRGGFIDEAGKRHASPHHYQFDVWEVLNEPDLEHQLSPRQYTTIYDAMVGAMKPIAPDMKFMGASLAFPGKHLDFFEYFLNPKNHKPGIPIDYISYHFYARPDENGESFESQPAKWFAQADNFIKTIERVQEIRRRLSPGTKTAINEVGSILFDADCDVIPPGYWNLSGAIYAYVYAESSRLGIEYIGQSQLLGSAGQYPSVSMIDWNTGKPNARWQVLKLLSTHLSPACKAAHTEFAKDANLHAQAFVSADGQKKLLLINKHNAPVTIDLPRELTHAHIVDQITAGDPPRKMRVEPGKLQLDGFAVAIVTE